ncbi:MAG: amino acid racemase [Chloroflexota bacterium]
MRTFSLGILTGISYVSGLDYYKGIHEKVLANTDKRHLMPPNPPMTMVSVDCDEYAHYLTSRDLDQVATYLLKGVDKLVATGCNLLVIASNTGHICVPAVEQAYPDLNVLHIADCCAYQLKRQGFTQVGLVGTQPTMEEAYLHDRLAQHDIRTLVPQETEVREEIYRIIYEELSFNDFRESSRQTMVDAMRRLGEQGAQACISGCTEIELLVQQTHIPEIPLLPSGEIHIETTADVLLGNRNLDDVLPG